jgi:nonsense-mediated mRNA decay protein 3
LFCVECGREEPELIGSLCHDCYSKKHIQASLPDHVDVTICAHCSSVLLGDDWEDVESIREAAEAVIRRAVSIPKGVAVSDLGVQLSERDERNLAAKVRVVLSSEGLSVEKELSTTVRLKRGSCKECSKQQGNYYEAVLQLRGNERSLPDNIQREIERHIRDRVAGMRKSNRGVFISKIERVKGGLDFFFSTSQAGRAVARELQESFCAEFKESSSLWGKREGEEIYRMTFLVRLPGFGPGDMIEFQSRDYYVRGMSRGVVHAIDPISGEERPIRLKELEACTLAAPKSKIVKAVVLFESASELQVLDPDTMAQVDLRKPAGFSRTSDHVRLAKTRLGTYPLSDSW